MKVNLRDTGIMRGYKGQWIARVSHNGIRRYLGMFPSRGAARQARDMARIRALGLKLAFVSTNGCTKSGKKVVSV